MNVYNFIINNWDSILAVVIIVIAILYGLKKGETKILKEICFSLVTKAEQEFGSGLGVLKYAAVADMIYQRIPSALKVLFTSKSIEKIIESVLEEAKEKWKTNKNLQEYIDSPSVMLNEIKESINVVSEAAVKSAVENNTTIAIQTAKEVLTPTLKPSTSVKE